MLISILSLFLTVSSVHATPLSAEIVKIERGQTPQDETLIYLDDGQIGFIAPTKYSLLTELKKSGLESSAVQIEMTEQHEVLALRVNPAHFKRQAQILPGSSVKVYTPTLFPDLQNANLVFQKFNRNYRRKSQCYNRAEIWTYEAFQNTQTRSMKVFLFFTSRFIREYRYGWWFHVSPYVMVNENGASVERVVDAEFTQAPTLLKDWTDIFIFPKTACPSVAKYSDYSQHQEEQYCYLIKVPMYFWQPRDLESFEVTGVEKTEFPKFDVEAAYRQGF